MDPNSGFAVFENIDTVMVTGIKLPPQPSGNGLFVNPIEHQPVLKRSCDFSFVPGFIRSS